MCARLLSEMEPAIRLWRRSGNRPWLDGEVRVTQGPYLETTEHMGGLWVLKAADVDEALAWGRKAAVACRAPVELRPFH